MRKIISDLPKSLLFTIDGNPVGGIEIIFEHFIHLSIFIVCVFLMIDLWICWRISQVNRETPALSWGGTLFFRMIGKIIGIVLLWRTMKKRRIFIPLYGRSTLQIRNIW